MSTFCLIHGSGQGPEGWRLLVEELEKRGHHAITPAFDLTRTDEGAAWHAQTIVDGLTPSQRPEDVVCVAHSASGLFLPIIAEYWRPRRIVFLAAFIPRPGVSAMQQIRTDRDPAIFNPAWLGKNHMDDAIALEFVFHDCPPARLAWALSTRIYFYAKQAIEEPCPLTTWPPVPATYIACADDRTITPAWQCKAARERLGVEPIVIPGGHCPHVSRPETLADVLHRAAE